MYVKVLIQYEINYIHVLPKTLRKHDFHKLLSSLDHPVSTENLQEERLLTQESTIMSRLNL